MSMIKIVGSGGWEFGDDPVSQIKMSSSGLSGNDLNSFVKRAGHYLADVVKKLDMAPGEVPVHMIALGSTEYLGPNRNGDGFKEASCIKYHPTFEKFAKFYRNHDNKPSSPSFGIVKKSLYNPEMRRVELIVGLNSTKEAASRNKGFVADKELEKLESGRDLGVSMSCKVAHDVCSWCGNKAKTRKDYCTADKCEGGGLKHNIGTLLKCGHVLHADNPEPIFFDISHVIRPADRTAYVTGVLGKEASSLSHQKLDEIFETDAPAWVPSSLNEPHLIKLARDLSLQEACESKNYFAEAFRSNQAEINLPEFTKVGHALCALSSVGAILPVEEFLSLTMGDRSKAASLAPSVRAYLPGIYAQLAESEHTDAYLGNVEWPAAVSGKLQMWASKFASDYGLTQTHLLHRVHKSFLEPKPKAPVAQLTKNAGANQSLAMLYGAYTLKALNNISNIFPNAHLTRKALLTQNYVC